MISKSSAKKIEKKKKRCQQIISNELEIEFTQIPTNTVLICNAGLSTGLKSELLIEHVSQLCRLKDVLMIPGKSYCFLIFYDVIDSVRAYGEMHGLSKLGQNDGILYLCYVQSIPDKVLNIENPWNLNKPVPNGLIVVENFIDEDEERTILESTKFEEDLNGKLLKHRQVKHFGYEFLYGTNNIDVNKPLEIKIPATCDVLWERLKVQQPNLKFSIPDQMTANKYEPGNGIPPHCDTHSAFEDPIFSLSLHGDIVMEFRKNLNKHAFVYVKRRSLLIMSGESRYGWTHGITPRMTDIIPSSSGLSIQNRTTRVSLTFRKLNFTPCECPYKTLCDTYLNKKEEVPYNPSTVEAENVHKVYNEIGNHFSETRHSPWPRVENFIKSLRLGSILCDIGCGNGKYLSSYPDIVKIGCDRSETLLKVCQERGFNVFLSDCLYLPIKSNSVDACISIAVIHHLASYERRLNAIREMVRILVKSGRALIYVWAKDQRANNKKSSYLRQNKKMNKIVNPEEIMVPHEINPALNLPIHVNRTEFQHSDVLVPWKLKNINRPDELDEQNQEKGVFLRYYHVFEETELVELCNEISDIRVVEHYYDQGNWCVIFEKL